MYESPELCRRCTLLAPTVGGLQKLIDLCDTFAQANDMIYNVKKSFCSAFIPKIYGQLYIPSVSLGQQPLKWVQQVKYLGAFINNQCSDDADISRQIQAIYSRGNTLVRNFNKCSSNVKVELFKTYCCNLYAAHLWDKYSAAKYQRIKIAYNNIFRSLMGIKRGESISAAYVASNVDGFQTIIRKAVYSFNKRVNESQNVLVKTVLGSAYFIYGSTMFKSWKKCLYLNLNV